MPCDTMRLPNQSFEQRKAEVRKAVSKIDQLIASKRVQVKVGPQGAVAFLNVSEEDRARMADACIYRTIARTGSAAAKMALLRAEQLAGRGVDKKVVAQGIHSHDGGTTWHPRG